MLNDDPFLKNEKCLNFLLPPLPPSCLLWWLRKIWVNLPLMIFALFAYGGQRGGGDA